MTDPHEEWQRACERAAAAVRDCPDHERVGDLAIDEAECLLALARHLRGVACDRCAGAGSYTYGSTATWHGGIGGAALTVGMCDRCWGSGRKDRPGPNLRAIQASLRRATQKREATSTLAYFAQSIGAQYETLREPLARVVEKLRRARFPHDPKALRAAKTVATAIEEACEGENA